MLFAGKMCDDGMHWTLCLRAAGAASESGIELRFPKRVGNPRKFAEWIAAKTARWALRFGMLDGLADLGVDAKVVVSRTMKDTTGESDTYAEEEEASQA